MKVIVRAFLTISLAYIAFVTYVSNLDWGPAMVIYRRLWDPTAPADVIRARAEDTHSLWRYNESFLPPGGGMEPGSALWLALALLYVSCLVAIGLTAIIRLRRTGRPGRIAALIVPVAVAIYAAKIAWLSWPESGWDVLAAILFWGFSSICLIVVGTLRAKPERSSYEVSQESNGY